MGKFKDIWDFGKDGNRGAQRSFVRFAIVATVIFLLFLVLRKDDAIRWIQSGLIVKEQKKQIEQLESRIKSLDETVISLTSDRDSLEKFARENFNFCTPEEDVYLTEK